MLVVDQGPWDQAAEIVIIGFGAAGAAAAITSHDLGADVLILEKQPADSHITTSDLSGGIFISPGDAAAATTYMEALSRVDGLSWTSRDVIQAWAKYACENKRWLKQLGGRVERHQGLLRGEYDLPGSDSIEVYHVLGLGWGFMRVLRGQVRARNIKILYDTPASKLLTNVKGEVIGVTAHCKGKQILIKAAKAVIMASGGFEFDEEMKLNYLRVYPTYFAGSPANTGDGIRMAQEVGASLWHMNCVSAAFVMKFPGFPFGLVANLGGSRGAARIRRDSLISGNPCGYIIVDKYGRRYTREQVIGNGGHAFYYELTLYDRTRREYPRVPSYWIFDRRRLDFGPLPHRRLGPIQDQSHKWSAENRAEIEKGWIIAGESISELADKLKMDHQVLEQEIRNHNRYCEQKEDAAFHRPARDLVPLVGPSFYAVALWPGSFNTQGGPRRNGNGQILDTDGNSIPRLYAAGELGSIFGMLYPTGGGNLSECIAFGRISGENAVAETPLP